MSTLLNDLKYGIRMLAKNPGLTLVIVLVLSLGISVSVALFGLVDAVGDSPFPDPNRIVHVSARSKTEDSHISYLDYLAVREQLTSLSGLATIRYDKEVLKKGGWSRRYEAALVSRNFFSVAQVKAHLGYMFSEDDSQELKDQPVVVLSYKLWKSHFGSDPEIIGQSILLSNVNRTVLGVAPPWFHSVTDEASSSFLWIPVDSQAKKENDTFPSMIGRLKPGAALSTLQMEAETAFSRLDLRDRETQTRLKPRVLSDRAYRDGGGSGDDPGEDVFLLAILNCVYLIVCLNISGLLLAKADSRRREMAVRRALGGGRGRLTRQLFTEGALLALLASAVSLLMVYWFMSLLQSRFPDVLPENLAIGIFNYRAVVFSLSIALGCTLLFEILPIWYTCSLDLASALRADQSRRSRLGRRLFGLPVVVVMQLAVSLILTVGAGHFLRSYLDARLMDLGFRKRNVLLAHRLYPHGDVADKVFFRGLVAEVQTLAGVENVGLARHLPISTYGRARRDYRVSLPDDEVQTGSHGEVIQANIVDSGYFPTMGIPVLAGHNFGEQRDPSDSRQVIVSQAFVSRFWPGKDPVGRFIQLENLDHYKPTKELVQVIGRVPDVGGSRTPDPVLYVPFGPVHSSPFMTLLVEARGNPHRLADPIRKIIQHLDHTVEVYAMTTLADEVKGMRFIEALFSKLAGSLSLFGLSLACVGLYGIIAFTVTRRTYELGVRIALGARSQDVMRIIMSQGLKLSLIGLGIGLIGYVVFTLVLRSFIPGIVSFDLVVIVISSTVVLGTAMLACYIPARRAARIDPMEALRCEG